LLLYFNRKNRKRNAEADIKPAGRVGESYLIPSGQVRIVGEPSTEQIL
jgi:hypothetical protein